MSNALSVAGGKKFQKKLSQQSTVYEGGDLIVSARVVLCKSQRADQHEIS